MCLIILAGFPQSILFGSPLASLSDFLSTERLPLHKVTIKLHLRLICKPFSPYSFISCQLPTACEGTASAIMFLATGTVNRLDKKIGSGSFGGHLHHACLFFILIVD